MKLPDEFVNRVYKTKISGFGQNPKRLTQMLESWPGSYIDVVYENGSSIVVLVFDSQEDCLAFTLKYGTEYV